MTHQDRSDAPGPDALIVDCRDAHGLRSVRFRAREQQCRSAPGHFPTDDPYGLGEALRTCSCGSSSCVSHVNATCPHFPMATPNSRWGGLSAPVSRIGCVHSRPTGLYRAHNCGTRPWAPHPTTASPRRFSLTRQRDPTRSGDVGSEGERLAPPAARPAPPADQVGTVPSRYQGAPFRIHTDGHPTHAETVRLPYR